MNHVKFIDGPAKGITLRLVRTPILLRVVRDPGGKFDALDQFDDVAEKNEAIFLYQMRGRGISGFIDVRDKNGKRFGEAFTQFSYAVFCEEIHDDILRDNAAWSMWCDANRERVIANWKYIYQQKETA